MYLQKLRSKITKSEVLICGYGSVQKFHGSATLIHRESSKRFLLMHCGCTLTFLGDADKHYNKGDNAGTTQYLLLRFYTSSCYAKLYTPVHTAYCTTVLHTVQRRIFRARICKQFRSLRVAPKESIPWLLKRFTKSGSVLCWPVKKIH